MFIIPTEIMLLEFQVKHYRERIANARSKEERMFLRFEHHRLKERLKCFYN